LGAAAGFAVGGTTERRRGGEVLFDAKRAKSAKNAKRSALELANEALEPRHRQSTSPAMMDCASKRRVKISESAVANWGP
jgi:hypothetical protein